MRKKLKTHADKIIKRALSESLPDSAVKKALKKLPFVKGKIVLVAIGKASWQMAKTAHASLGDKLTCGVVITKYNHSKGVIGNLVICEAAHPVSDENSYKATQKALEVVEGLSKDDLVLFLVSGGGSALFEKPLIPQVELEDVTKQLLGCGAGIVEINTIRKRFSSVKGGKFAQLCSPAKVFSIILSDIIGDPLDMIASGPAYPDSSTCSDALDIVKKYGIKLSKEALELLHVETPKELKNVTTTVSGSVTQLCKSAKKEAKKLGYKPFVLSASLSCEAKEAGSFLGSIAQFHAKSKKSFAFIVGGETVVNLKGEGLGGRNQELALSSALQIDGLKGCAIFSLGSDGTDGPTDAAGGYVDYKTKKILVKKAVDIDEVLAQNDSYYALKKCDGLIVTGATGTNVNDLSVVLINR